MKPLLYTAVPLLALFAAAQAQQPAGKPLAWAYPVPDPTPAATADNAPKQLPGSGKSFTQAQIDDQFKPPDWYPNEHAPLPRLVSRAPSLTWRLSVHLQRVFRGPTTAAAPPLMRRLPDV